MGNAFVVGTQFMTERKTGKFPPEPDNSNHYWELSHETDYERVFILRSKPDIVGTKENLEQIIKDREGTIRELSARNASLDRENIKVTRDKATITKAFDERGVELTKLRQDYDDLREGTMKLDSLILSRKEEHDQVYRENLQLKEDVRVLRDLQPKEGEQTTKESMCAESVVNPDWIETDKLHTERMRLQNEELDLNNQLKTRELRFGKDYPASLWAQTEFRLKVVDKFKGWLIGLYGAVVAIGINEVIQWLTR